MLSDRYGSSAGLPKSTCDTSALRIDRPSSMSVGLERVMVLDRPARTIAWSVRFQEMLADGSQFSYFVSRGTMLTRSPSFWPSGSAGGPELTGFGNVRRDVTS